MSKEAGLYIIATPIGNLGDISLRALSALNSADLILCEDTRTTKNLLGKYGISGKLDSYNDVNGGKKRPAILEKLQQGQMIALVSDAGTPLISDPGYKLVSEAANLGIKIIPLPGASALIAALSCSGLPTDNFTFMGFYNKKKLKKSANSDILIFYESAKRLVKTLEELQTKFGDCNSCIAREITKIYEEFRRGKLSENIEYYKNHPPKGEIVIIIEAENIESASDEDIEKMLIKKLQTQKLGQASEEIATELNISKKKVYQIGLKLKNH